MLKALTGEMNNSDDLITMAPVTGVWPVTGILGRRWSVGIKYKDLNQLHNIKQVLLRLWLTGVLSRAISMVVYGRKMEKTISENFEWILKWARCPKQMLNIAYYYIPNY